MESLIGPDLLLTADLWCAVLCTAAGITNGAEWYPLYGGMQDWNYVSAGCMEITLELNQQKRPPTSELPKVWNENLSAMLNLPIAAVLGGISGTVTSSTGQPLRGAEVTVAGNAMKAVARGPAAYFNKPSAPGSYTVTASAPGYAPQTATVVVPQGGAGAIKNFVLSNAL
jgi:carboxypeptidase D